MCYSRVKLQDHMSAVVILTLNGFRVNTPPACLESSSGKKSTAFNTVAKVLLSAVHIIYVYAQTGNLILVE